MKQSLKLGLLTFAAAFVLGTATPAMAQQATMQASGAASRSIDRQAAAERYAATQNYDVMEGEDAYAYAPADFGLDSCATQGSFGQGLDYSACGGE